MQHEEQTTRDQLAALERRMRRLRVIVGLLLVVAGGAGAILAFAAPRIGAGETLRAREIVIEDANGVVRARLGADLPDAEFQGRRIDRGASASGLLLYDEQGIERSGYVTFDGADNVVLTLDAGTEGNNRQVAYFIADPDGTAALRIWNGEGDHVELRTGSDGAWINAVEDGRLVSQSPEIRDPTSTSMCAELRGLRDRAEPEELLAACRQRMPEEACRLCLGNP